MPARRCNPCSTNWPVSLKLADDQIEQFLNCPECTAKTDFFGNAEPIDNDEARSRVLHAHFETFYAEWSSKQFADELEHVELGGN